MRRALDHWTRQRGYGLRFYSILVLVLTGACTDEGPSRPGVEFAVSGGVPLVVHHEAPSEWLELTEEPLLVIPNALSDGVDLFRVRGGILLENGGVALANSGANEAIIFHPDGTVRARVGRGGEGPGEFNNILWIQRCEEGRICICDPGNHRITRIALSGSLQGTTDLRFEPEGEPSEEALVGQGFPIGVAGEGRILAVPWAVARFSGKVGPLPLMGELRLYGPDFAEFTMVDTVQLRTWWEEAQPEGPPIGQILEAPSFVFSGNGTRIAYSDATSHRVEVLENGVLSLIIVEDRSRIPFEPDSIPDYMSGAADSLPAYRSLVVDSDRRIWLESSEDSGGNDGRVWRLVSADGSAIQSLTIPASRMVLDARGDRVLLLERDSLDVETAVVRQFH